LILTVESPTVVSRTTKFKIQKHYIVLALSLSVLCVLLPCTALTDRFCITKVEIVYCAVRTESLFKTEKLRL